MRIEISLKREIQKLNRELGQLKSKQLPHAMAKTLNQLALEARPIIQSEFEAGLDVKKKSMLRKAIQVEFASKNDFPYSQSIVGVMKEFSFLTDHVFGMQRKAQNSHGKAIPKEIKRLSSGMVPKSQRPGVLLKKKGVFTIVSGGGREILAKHDEGSSGGMKILYVFSPSVKIKKTIDVEPKITSFVGSKFDKILGEQLARAIKSAK